MSRRPRTRVQKLASLAEKTFGERKITEQEADELLNKYVTGQSQQMKGEVIALTIEKFLARLPERVRVSLESNVRDLRLHSANSNRFRRRVFTILMAVYQNGTVSGANSREVFDIEGLIKQAAADIEKKYGLDS